MTHDQWLIVGMAAGWSAAAGAVGVALVWLLRRRSLRWSVGIVALVAVGGFVSGLLATARAMFLSGHDFQVVLIVTAVAGVVSLGFALVVAEGVVRRSRSLRAVARSLADGGEVAAAPGGPAELQQVSEELRRTSQRLAESRARERQLESSRRELVAWVSHDLRTPLAGLRAMTEALEDDLVADPPRYHRLMRTEVDRMARMVDDLFELSRIHAGALTLSIEDVPLDDVISDALAGANPVAQAREVRLDGSVEQGLVVPADARELSRAVTNLLMNAIRHTPSDGAIWVSGRRENGHVEIAVRDSCGGLSPDALERVFDVGWRGSDARTPDGQSGAGLGLAIVRGIVEAHRGTVAVANEDGGCRFLLTLPG